jgi:hypothetical protein
MEAYLSFLIQKIEITKNQHPPIVAQVTTTEDDNTHSD